MTVMADLFVGEDSNRRISGGNNKVYFFNRMTCGELDAYFHSWKIEPLPLFTET